MSNRCEICYQDFEENVKQFYCNNCGENYHRSCIEAGTQHIDVCPMCKEPFSETFSNKRSTSHQSRWLAGEKQPVQITSIEYGNRPTQIIVSDVVLLFSLLVLLVTNNETLRIIIFGITTISFIISLVGHFWLIDKGHSYLRR